MKTRSRPNVLAAVAAVAALLLAAVAAASGDESETPVQVAEASSHRSVEAGNDSSRKRGVQEEATEAAEVAVVYRPPRRGAPRTNVGAGGVRGARALPQLLALAPDHVGLTTRATPSLFWYVDALPEGGLAEGGLDVVFTLNREDRIEPLVEATLAPPGAPGIQRVRLADHGVKLAPDVDYEWSIALVGQDEPRPQLVVSVGYLRRVERPADLPGAAPDAAAYARAGLWYDALTALGDAIERHPGDATLRSQRSSLLSQARLEPAAD